MPRLHLSLEETSWKHYLRFPEPPTGDDIHVWRLPVSGNAEILRKAKSVLTGAEVDKANRYRFARDRHCSLLARASLKILAGRYLNVSACDVEVGLKTNGKPYLKNQENKLVCNLSHAAGWIVLAFGANTSLGIDIESIDPRVEVENIAASFFSRMEIPMIMGNPPERRAEAFFYAWTRKEALIKATGEGLSLPLSEFGVSIGPAEELKVLHTDWAPQEAEKWELISFMAAPELPGAVARKGRIGNVRFFDWVP